jgi:hypothetical protein
MINLCPLIRIGSGQSIGIRIFSFIFLFLSLSPITQAQDSVTTSNDTVIHKEIEIAIGFDVIEKVDFDITSRLASIEPEGLLYIVLSPQKKEIIFKGINPGKSSLVFKDQFGKIKIKYDVTITGPASSEITLVEKYRDLVINSGDEKFEKLDFNNSAEFHIGNERLLSLSNHPDKKNVGIVFKGLRPGKTTVIIRDVLGVVRRRYSVVINASASSTNTEVEKNVEVFVGNKKNVKLNFEVDQKLLIDNVDLLKVDVLPFTQNDFRLNFNGLKVGKTSVTIKDTSGVVRRKYNVNIIDAAEPIERGLTVILGHEEIEKVDFDLYSKVSFGNENILKVIVNPEKKEIIFKGLKPGRTSVVVRDEEGDVRRQYIVFIPDPLAN